MQMLIRNILSIFVPLALVCCCATSCKKRVGMTTVAIVDSVRHYYPVLTGQVITLSYELENTGDQPLIIRDIQPSCGCIEPQLDSKMVLPGKKVRLLFKYESAKNIGYVQQVIRVHGNIKPNGIAKMLFDINVVPNADYTRDYEELYKEAVERSAMVRGLVDGDEKEKGYWTDDISHDSRAQEKYPWRE